MIYVFLNNIDNPGLAVIHRMDLHEDKIILFGITCNPSVKFHNIIEAQLIYKKLIKLIINGQTIVFTLIKNNFLIESNDEVIYDYDFTCKFPG